MVWQENKIRSSPDAFFITVYWIALRLRSGESEAKKPVEKSSLRDVMSSNHRQFDKYPVVSRVEKFLASYRFVAAILR